MMFFVLLASILWTIRVRYTFAQGLPTPIYDKVIESKIYGGVKISYKEVSLLITVYFKLDLEQDVHLRFQAVEMV
jgi:hypothetical protein